MRHHSHEPRPAGNQAAMNARSPTGNAAVCPDALDPATRNALAAFKAMLSARYGEHLRGLYLFGSRARGDHRPDSDADVAVFLDQVTDPLGEQLDLIERGYKILLDTDINIQPWVFEYASLADPGRYRAPHLVRTICAEGVRLGLHGC